MVLLLLRSCVRQVAKRELSRKGSDATEPSVINNMVLSVEKALNSNAFYVRDSAKSNTVEFWLRNYLGHMKKMEQV